jgi:hypothetical protein
MTDNNQLNYIYSNSNFFFPKPLNSHLIHLIKTVVHTDQQRSIDVLGGGERERIAEGDVLLVLEIASLVPRLLYRYRDDVLPFEEFDHSRGVVLRHHLGNHLHLSGKPFHYWNQSSRSPNSANSNRTTADYHHD